MRLRSRLFVRIWLAMVAALLVTAVIVALAWRYSFEGGLVRGEFAGLAADIATELLPADLAGDRLQSALNRWSERLRLDLALHDANRYRTAAAGRTLPDLPRDLTASEWIGAGSRAGAYALRLHDGRWLLARHQHTPTHRPLGFIAMLAGIGAVLAILAWPLARRLTRRLERLRGSVESLGEGNLAARVTVRGHDEIAALAASFNRAAERIEALVTSQKSLLANASHELRSPLARLRMSVESLQAGADRAVRASIAQDITELDQLIDEIILASRLDAGLSRQRPFEAVDLTGLAAEECARAGADLEAASVVMSGDPVLLRRMLRNLLENARRHGSGTYVEATLGTDHSGAITLAVLDRGPGVPAAERERIFEPFYRLAGASERGGGAGLGLALVRKIAQVHGGSARCEARAGGGSAFIVTLPGQDGPAAPSR